MRIPFISRKPAAAGPQPPKKKKSVVREWIDSLLWAACAAIIIRTFFFEAFLIPTSSMERTMMVGDFLVVSKLHYGIRLPQVPLAVPLIAHNRLPLVGGKSYLDWIVFGYARIPGFQDIERDQPFVFNYPADDIYYNDLYGAGTTDTLGAITIPAMKENYVKRCVAVAGDLFEVRDGDVFIDNVRQALPTEAVVRYRVVFKPTANGQPMAFSTTTVPEFKFRGSNDQGRELELVYFDTAGAVIQEFNTVMSLGLYRARYTPLDTLSRTHYWIYATQTVAQQLAAFQNVDTLYRDPMPRGYVLPGPQWQPRAAHAGTSHFPFDTARFPFNNDHWGPIHIPKEGETVTLTAENIDWYERIIGVHEGHELVVQRTPFKVTIDGQPATTYTFEMDYFFAMGDNRYSSADSRFWGFVPEDHVVGKPVMVLFSKEGSDWRWERVFNAVD